MKHISLLIILLFSLAGILSAHPFPGSQDPLETEEVVDMVDDIDPMSPVNHKMGPLDEEMQNALRFIISNYSKPWEELSMQGKLSFDGLPIRPSVKFYMKRGESIILSARAPLFGEVARIELSPQSLLIINKHTKKYCTFDMSTYTAQYPSMVADFQDILLGEIVYPGFGRMTSELADKSFWSYESDDIFILPDKQLQWQNMGYGFLVDMPSFKLRDIILFFHSTDLELDFSYLFGIEGWTLGLAGTLHGHDLNGSLQLSYPDYFPVPVEFTDLDERYTPTDLRNVLKF